MNETPRPAAERPGFAISVPVGGWDRFLGATLRSLALQDVPLQVAFLDAGEDPRTRQDAETSGIDFAYRRHGPDEGQADAIAEGWEQTDAEIVGWLNADDALLPGALSGAADAFAADPELDVWFGQSLILDEAGEVTGLHPAVRDADDLLLRSCTISQPSCFVRRRALDAAGGLDRSRHFTMDWDLWIRLYRNGAKFRRTDDILSSVIWAQGTKTSGISPARMTEIHRLVQTHAGPVAAAKSTLGFLMHHVAAYTPMREPLRRLRGRGMAPEFGTPTHGLAGSGRLMGTSVLPVINLHAEPRARLHLAVECEDGESVTLTGPGGERECVRDTADLALAAPVPPGGTASVTLTPSRPGTARLIRLGLRD